MARPDRGTAFGIASARYLEQRRHQHFTGNDVTNAAVAKETGSTASPDEFDRLLGDWHHAVNTVTVGTTMISNNMISGVCRSVDRTDSTAGIFAGRRHGLD